MASNRIGKKICGNQQRSQVIYENCVSDDDAGDEVGQEANKKTDIDE